MSEIDPTAAAGFSSAAEVYERARPGYPEAAVAWIAEQLGIRPGRVVLDLGAGTGKLTRQLVPLGARIVAVEPLQPMRDELERAVPAAEVLAGTAEAIPLADASVDAATCAAAFHWFRPAEALCELHRVLRPNGGVALVWNARDESDPLQKTISAILDPLRGSARGGRVASVRSTVAASALFGEVEEETFAHEQQLTLERFVERYASVSFVAALAPAERGAVLERIRSAAEGVDEPIRVPYVTRAFAFRRRGPVNHSNEGSSAAR